MLSEREKQILVIDEERAKAHGQTMVVELPRADLDISDSCIGVGMTDEKVDEQIKLLFDEHVRYKRAYRQALNKSAISNIGAG